MEKCSTCSMRLKYLKSNEICSKCISSRKINVNYLQVSNISSLCCDKKIFFESDTYFQEIAHFEDVKIKKIS